MGDGWVGEWEGLFSYGSVPMQCFSCASKGAVGVWVGGWVGGWFE